MIIIRETLSNSSFISFVTKLPSKKKITKITPFYFKILNNFFYFSKFETLSPKLYPLTVTPKFILVYIGFLPFNKTYFGHFFIESYFVKIN